jgi:hypothetical protein
MTVRGSLRVRICPSCGDAHELDNWPANHARPGEVLAAPQVIRDDMPAVQSQVDGSWHESKRGIRKTYEPSGNAEGKKFLEVGNDPARLRPRQKIKPDRAGIKESVQKAAAQLRNGQVTERTYQTKVITRPGPI